jgi:alanine racemase
MSFIKLNKSAFFNNLDIIAKKTADITKISLVLKDNAYGHGLLEIASMAREYGISRAVVRNEAEAQKITATFPYILILSPTFSSASHPSYRYTINSLDDIEKFPPSSRVELKIDTGMHRNGIAEDQLEEAFAKIERYGLKLEGLFTHYRSADALSSEWFWQKKNFEQIKARARRFDENLRFHACNSAALFRSANVEDEMVRVGIAAYGCLKMDEGFAPTGLKPVLSLWAEKISSRELKKGEKIGYNATFEADKDMLVTNYDLGYADGLLRSLSNNYRTPSGHALLGRVSMDNSSYDCGEDKLLVFDDANEIASYAGTIGYEILVRLSSSIERKIIG